jgi:hypothetical protein
MSSLTIRASGTVGAGYLGTDILGSVSLFQYKMSLNADRISNEK